MIETVIDDYLLSASDPARTTFQAVRTSIHVLVPGLEECMSYGIPAFRTPQGVVAGLAINKRFCSFYPFSGSVLERVASSISAYGQTKSALHFAFDTPLPAPIVKVLIEARLDELASK